MFSSKELYMMNGGNKLYIHKDGFGDVYDATPAEEAEWAKEVVANALTILDTGKNATALDAAIDNLLFHKYPDVAALLLAKMQDADPTRQIAFAGALWKLCQYERSFEIIFQNLQRHRSECLNEVFSGLTSFKNNDEAKHFLIACLEGDDDVLLAKTQVTLGNWAYSGMPALRENNLMDALSIENKNTTAFKAAIQQLKKVFRLL